MKKILQRQKRKKNEDSLTSSVFQLFRYFPDDLLTNILNKAVSNGILHIREPIFEFWPHWPPQGTENSNFIEPDIYIYNEKMDMNWDIIIEAKYGTSQKQEQLENEIIAYYNKYPHSMQTLIIIAIDGTQNLPDYIKYGDKNIQIYKISWLYIAIVVQRELETLAGYQKRVCQDIIEVFRYFGIHAGKLLSETDFNSFEINSNALEFFQERRENEQTE